MKKTKKWKQTKIMLGVVATFIIAMVGYDKVDPFYHTTKRVSGTIVKSVQKVERYSNGYKEIVIETNNGNLHSFRVHSTAPYYQGERVELKVLERKYSGVKKYVL